MKRSGSGDNNYSSECNKDFHICLEFVFVERVNSLRAHRTLMLIERSWSIFIQIIGWPVKICIKFLVCIDSSLPQINMLIAYLCIWFLLLLFGAAVADTRPGSIDAYVVRWTQWPSDLISANMTIILIWLNVNMNFCVFYVFIYFMQMHLIWIWIWKMADGISDDWYIQFKFGWIFDSYFRLYRG